MKQEYLFTLAIMLSCLVNKAWAQPDTITIGYGQYSGVNISTSDESGDNTGDNTMNQDGYLPNENAASRFLSQSTMGFSEADIQSVMMMGIEDWIEGQFSISMPTTLTNSIRAYHDFVRTATNNPDAGDSSRFWDYAWWQYHMTSNDLLRQRIAWALSQLLVISDKSNFGGNPYALGNYYDILLTRAFDNYRNILTDVTYHPSMGRYLTHINNPKTDTSANQFPDENYAREVMQLFTIGTTLLNPDGTMQYDTAGTPIPSYDNMDIQEYSKVFTGLSWEDRTSFFRGPLRDTSYLFPMKMFNDYHEPGEKYLLTGDTIPNRDPINGDADITDALDNLFEHPNTAPFISKFLIQRLVTANPSPEYVQRVATVFTDNGQGIRGDMKAVIKAILLDQVAEACQSGENPSFGSLREPFMRYVQLNKAMEVYTTSGNYRNDMRYIEDYTSQKPLTSPSVFNFYQQDYQPIGPIEEANMVAPVFQITDAQSITGYINSLDRFIVDGNIADEYDLYNGEPNSSYEDEISQINWSTDTLYVNDDQIHILLDKYNLLFAQGRVSNSSLEIIKQAIQNFPNDDADDKLLRAELTLYLLLTSPEYLINR